MESEKVKKIIVFKLRNIGDVLLVTPVLRALKEKFTGARLVMVVCKGTEGVLENNPDVDEVIVFDRGLKGLARLGHEIGLFLKMLSSSFDLAINLTEGERAMWYALLCGRGQRWGWVGHRSTRLDIRRWIYHKPISSDTLDLHEVETAYHLLRQAGLDLPVHPLRFRVDEPGKTWASAEWSKFGTEGPKVVVHPVSRWLFKSWSPESMAATIDWLQRERGARLIVTTGPNDKERAAAEKVVNLCKVRPTFLAGTCTLMQLAALTEQADLFFGVDTAPMHVAAAVQTPVVALFGPTSIRSWGPWKVRRKVLQKSCICNANGAKRLCDWEGTRDCLASITVDEVKQALDEMLQPVEVQNV